MMNEEFNEYITFTITDKEGKEVEMAVVDEFEFEKKNYAVAAMVVDDTINEDALYIYRIREDGDDYAFDKISNAIDYEKIANAYMEMDS